MNEARQVERMIRQNKNGGFAVIISRHVGTINGSPKTRSVYYGGLGSIEEARALRTKLEAANPPTRSQAARRDPARSGRGAALLRGHRHRRSDLPQR